MTRSWNFSPSTLRVRVLLQHDRCCLLLGHLFLAATSKLLAGRQHSPLVIHAGSVNNCGCAPAGFGVFLIIPGAVMLRIGWSFHSPSLRFVGC